MKTLNIPQTEQKRVVVVGGGFAGLTLVQKLRKSNYQVVLVDQNNFHLFKPLLYQVASAGLDESDIAFPFRRVFQTRRNVNFRLGRMLRVKPEENLLETSTGSVTYDYLVIATGCVPNFFGMDHIEQRSWPMSDIGDALRIRNSVLRNLEKAVIATSKEERNALLNIVIVGGGASGVEIAGALAEMRSYIVPRDYPGVNISSMHIYLVEGRDKLLATMSPETSSDCLKVLEKKGVNVMLNTAVKDYQDNRVIFGDGTSILSGNLIWTSGVKSEAVEGIGNSEKERRGRILTDRYNRVQGFDNIFAIGDIAITDDPQYPAGYPQLARVAISQGEQIAANLIAVSKGKPMEPYEYRSIGVLATVGRNRAFAEWGKFRIKGFMAWLAWCFVHILFLLGVQNKIKVFSGWVWNYFGKDLPVRLIIGCGVPCKDAK